MTFLVVTPTRREAAALHRLPVSVFVCGSGQVAGEATAARIDRERPDGLLITGFCGALDPSLAAGTIILGRQVVLEGRDDLIPCQALFDGLREQLRRHRVPFVTSRLLTVARPAATRAEKADLWNAWGAGGVDMETYPVARAAADAGVPWIALRAVVDPSKQSLPASLRSWSQEADERQILWKAVRHPAEWPGYGRLALQMPRARRSLRAGVRIAVRESR